MAKASTAVGEMSSSVRMKTFAVPGALLVAVATVWLGVWLVVKRVG
jgi:flagellar biogenesis protein FliO